MEDVDFADLNAINMNAKKVLTALSGYEKGILLKGEIIQKKTGLAPEVINESVMSLHKSLLVDIPYPLKDLAPYNFYAVEINDFGRQVLQQFS